MAGYIAIVTIRPRNISHQAGVSRSYPRQARTPSSSLDPWLPSGARPGQHDLRRRSLSRWSGLALTQRQRGDEAKRGKRDQEPDGIVETHNSGLAKLRFERSG